MALTVRVSGARVAIAIGPVSPEALRPAEDAIDGLGIRLAVVRRTAELLGGGLDLDVCGPDARTLIFRVRGAPDSGL